MNNYYQKLSENIFKKMYSAFKNKLGSMRLEPPHPMDNAFASPYHRKRDADPPSLQDIHPALGTDAKPKSGPKESPFWTNNPERAKFRDAYRSKAAARGRIPNPNYKEKKQTVESNIMNYRQSIRALFEAVLLEGERKMQMKRDSDKYPGGPAEKRLYQAKPGQLTPDGKKQLQQGAKNYAKNAGKKAR